MDLTGNEDLIKIKKTVALYNMVANLFWSALSLTPISVFCYRLVDVKLCVIFLGISLLAIFLPKVFFDNIQLGKTTSVYKKIGVDFFNRFTQHGDIINGLIRKKFPLYKAIYNRKSSINALLSQTYIFEKFHFTVFLFFSLATIYALIRHYFIWALILLIINLVYNVYPIFLQQFIRLKLLSAGKRKL